MAQLKKCSLSDIDLVSGGLFDMNMQALPIVHIDPKKTHVYYVYVRGLQARLMYYCGHILKMLRDANDVFQHPQWCLKPMGFPMLPGLGDAEGQDPKGRSLGTVGWMGRQLHGQCGGQLPLVCHHECAAKTRDLADRCEGLEDGALAGEPR